MLLASGAALSHAISAACGTHHGLAKAIVLPHVLAFNRKAAEPRMADIARTIGLPEASGAAPVHWAGRLCATLGIPATLDGLGMRQRNAARLGRLAAQDPNAATPPGALTGRWVQLC